jgi:hypothetical protein
MRQRSRRAAPSLSASARGRTAVSPSASRTAASTCRPPAACHTARGRKRTRLPVATGRIDAKEGPDVLFTRHGASLCVPPAVPVRANTERSSPPGKSGGRSPGRERPPSTAICPAATCCQPKQSCLAAGLLLPALQRTSAGAFSAGAVRAGAAEAAGLGAGVAAVTRTRRGGCPGRSAGWCPGPAMKLKDPAEDHTDLALEPWAWPGRGSHGAPARPGGP